MTDCAPFSLAAHRGITYIVRDGRRVRPATPEERHLWQRRPEALVTLCACDWGNVWGLEGNGWQYDPDRLRALAEALVSTAGDREQMALIA